MVAAVERVEGRHCQLLHHLGAVEPEDPACENEECGTTQIGSLTTELHPTSFEQHLLRAGVPENCDGHRDCGQLCVQRQFLF